MLTKTQKSKQIALFFLDSTSILVNVPHNIEDPDIKIVCESFMDDVEGIAEQYKNIIELQWPEDAIQEGNEDV